MIIISVLCKNRICLYVFVNCTVGASTKNFHYAKQTFTVKGRGKGGVVNPLNKKGKLVKNIFFEIMLNKVLKGCEKWFLDVKANVNKAIRNKITGGCIRAGVGVFI